MTKVSLLIKYIKKMIWRNLFLILLRFFTSNLLSVLIGIITGLGINLYTNQSKNDNYSYAIILSIISILFLSIMIWIQDWFQIKVNSTLRNSTMKTLKTIWEEVEDNNKWVKHIFNILFFTSSFLIVITISCIREGNIEINKAQNEEKKFTNSLKEIPDLNKQLINGKIDSLIISNTSLKDSLSKIIKLNGDKAKTNIFHGNKSNQIFNNKLNSTHNKK